MEMMKPRLAPAALTLEDFQIIVGLRMQSTERTLKPEWWYRDSDRRDADLMFYAMRNGRLGYVVGTGFELVWVRAPSAYQFGMYLS